MSSTVLSTRRIVGGRKATSNFSPSQQETRSRRPLDRRSPAGSARRRAITHTSAKMNTKPTRRSRTQPRMVRVTNANPQQGRFIEDCSDSDKGVCHCSRLDGFVSDFLVDCLCLGLVFFVRTVLGSQQGGVLEILACAMGRFAMFVACVFCLPPVYISRSAVRLSDSAY